MTWHQQTRQCVDFLTSKIDQKFLLICVKLYLKELACVLYELNFSNRGNSMPYCKKFRGCTHRGSKDDECVCVGMTGLLLSIQLPPELSKHLRASQRLRAHLLAHLLSVCPYCSQWPLSFPCGYTWHTHTAWWNFNCHHCNAEKKSASKCCHLLLKRNNASVGDLFSIKPLPFSPEGWV